MNFKSRKEITKKIICLEKMLANYNDPNEKKFLENYLGADHIELSKDKILKAIEKLKEVHDKIPFGRIFEGPYYVRDYMSREAVVKNEPLLLKDGFIMWTKIDSKMNLWDYVKNPYKDSNLSTLLNPKDGHPIYSKDELKDILQINQLNINNAITIKDLL